MRELCVGLTGLRQHLEGPKPQHMSQVQKLSPLLCKLSKVLMWYIHTSIRLLPKESTWFSFSHTQGQGISLLAQFGSHIVKQKWKEHHPLMCHCTSHPQTECFVNALPKIYFTCITFRTHLITWQASNQHKRQEMWWRTATFNALGHKTCSFSFWKVFEML